MGDGAIQYSPFMINTTINYFVFFALTNPPMAYTLHSYSWHWYNKMDEHMCNAAGQGDPGRHHCDWTDTQQDISQTQAGPCPFSLNVLLVISFALICNLKSPLPHWDKCWPIIQAASVNEGFAEASCQRVRQCKWQAERENDGFSWGRMAVLQPLPNVLLQPHPLHFVYVFGPRLLFFILFVCLFVCSTITYSIICF